MPLPTRPARARPAARLVARSLAPAIAAALVGCSAGREESYSVSLLNRSSDTVTVWLTKTGDREQADWLAPEDLSTARIASVDQVNGTRVPPGRTAEVGPVKGRFAYEDRAVLRVYAGAVSFDQLLATSADDRGLRVDLPLREGMNRLEVAPGAGLKVQRIEAAGNGSPAN